MKGLVAFFHFAVVDVADDVLAFVGVQFLAEMDFVDLFTFKKLLMRDALEVEHLHKVHHIVGTEHRI